MQQITASAWIFLIACNKRLRDGVPNSKQLMTQKVKGIFSTKLLPPVAGENNFFRLWISSFDGKFRVDPSSSQSLSVFDSLFDFLLGSHQASVVEVAQICKTETRSSEVENSIQNELQSNRHSQLTSTPANQDQVLHQNTVMKRVVVEIHCVHSWPQSPVSHHGRWKHLSSLITSLLHQHGSRLSGFFWLSVPFLEEISDNVVSIDVNRCTD